MKRTDEELDNKLNELCDKMWLSRHLSLVEHGLVTKEQHPKAFEIEKDIRNKYGWQDYKGETDLEWGEIRGARRALEWISGEDWDCALDT